MPKTQTERLWLFGGIVVAILMSLIGYAMLIGPQNSSTISAQSQVSAAKADNAALRVRINALRAQSKDVADYEADLRRAELALPGTSGLPDFLRTLQSIGNATLTSVPTLTVGTPTDVTGVATGVQTSATSSGNTAVAPRAGVRVYALPITALISGTTDQLNQFLTQLQSVQPRAVLISELVEGTAAGGSAPIVGTGTTLQLTMQAFVAPTSAAEKAQLSAASGR